MGALRHYFTGPFDRVAVQSDRDKTRRRLRHASNVWPRSYEFEVVEVGVGGGAVALDLPDAGVGLVVGLVGEGSDEAGAVPLEAVVGQGGIVAVVERDQVGAFMAAVAGVFGIVATVPVERELVCARVPLLVGQASPNAGL